MLIFQLNYVAILVSAIIYLGIAALWYSPLILGKSWMDENQLKVEEVEKRGIFPALGYAFAAALILSLGLAILIQMIGSAHWFRGALVGLFAGLLISAPSALPVYVFENRSMRLFFINEGMPIFALIIMGAVIGGWK